MGRTMARAGLMLVVLVGLAGCARGRVPVEGIVTLDGKPVPGAVVSIAAEDGGGQPAHALSGADGSFRVQTLRQGDGAWPGSYRVAVAVPVPPPDAGITPGMTLAEQMRRYGEAMRERAEHPVKPPMEIPATYTSFGTTPLRLEVPAGGRITLELHTPGR